MPGRGGRPKGATKDRRERMKQCLQLREGGATYQRIADVLGISKAQAFNDVKYALKEITREDAESLLTLELNRLDAMWLPVYTKARKGDLKAIEACLKIHTRRCRLLGLEIEHRQITVNSAKDIQEAFKLIEDIPLDELINDDEAE